MKIKPVMYQMQADDSHDELLFRRSDVVKWLTEFADATPKDYDIYCGGTAILDAAKKFSTMGDDED